MLVKWVWSNSSCFSHSSDGCGCFIYPAMCRTHTDILKLIKKASMGCQIWAAAFLCNLLYQIKNLDNQGCCQISNEVFRVNSVNWIQSASEWLLFLVQQELGDWWGMNPFHWIPVYCPVLFNSTPIPAQTPTMSPTTVECWPTCHRCALDKTVPCYVQAGKHSISDS